MATLADFKQEWFASPEWWFSKDPTHDEVIIHRYEHLLNETYVVEPDALAVILIYDQLSRHVFRNTLSNHIINYYLHKALVIVESLISTSYVSSLSAIEWTFFMLPLRHTKDSTNIKQVISSTWQKIINPSTTLDELSIYKRFIKATYQRFLIDIPSQSCMLDYYDAFDIHATNISKSQYNDILSFKGEDEVESECSKYNPISLNTLLFNQTEPIILSLSGGVDSMVCSWLLKKHQMVSSCIIIAVHINYDNRPQCNQEVMFLRDWCRQLNIPLYVRKIDEIHRADCMEYELRDLYESYTRDVRYGTYKSVIPHGITPQVVLGHNKDDCLENIMTNLCHKNKYDNLQGMEWSSVQDGICFIRPLLSVNKDNIIAFAKANNIPFLPNSTPTWSQRGQIRNSIVPCLDKWDTRFVPSLYSLTDTLKELHNILQARVCEFMEQGSISDTLSHKTFITTITLKSLPCEIMFWREFLLKTFKVHVSSKSLDNMRITLEKIKTEDKDISIRKIVLRKGLCLVVESINMLKVKLTISDMH